MTRIVIYRKLSNISGTKSQNLDDFRLVLPLSLLNPLKTGVKETMKMWSEWSTNELPTKVRLILDTWR